MIHFNANKLARQGFFKMKQKAEITFEVEESIILRQVAGGLTALCPRCRAQSEMIAPQHAAALAGLSEREIFRLMEAGKIHFIETDRVYVCRDSLTNAAE